MFKRIKKVFISENSIRGASLILMVTLAASNVLGVIRDHFLAQKIPTDRLDIYYAAFRFPDLIFNVLILGSIAAAFVPVYSKYIKEKGDKEANEMAQATISVGILVVSVALVIMFFLMGGLIELLVPNFSPQKKMETVEMARWLLASPFIFTLSYFFGGILNARKRFLAYSIAPLFYNLAIITGVVLFADKLGVKGVIIGVISGAFLHMLIQLPSVLQVGLKPALRFDFTNPGVKRVIKLMIPRAIGLGSNQILLFAFTCFASYVPGAIAIYNLTDNIQTVPSVIFGSSLATAAFPTLSGLSLNVEKEKDRFASVFIRSIRAALFFLIPSTAVIFVLRAQIIRLILGYGFFGWADTKAASAALGFFALSVVAQGIIPIIARSFYAIHDTRTPMKISIVSIIVSIVFGYIFSRQLTLFDSSVAGLALAFSIGSWVNLILLVYYISGKIKIGFKKIFAYVAMIIVLTLITSVAMQFTKILVSSSFDINRVRYLLLQTILSLAVGALVYLFLGWLFKIREIRS
jgi:putative peptidoglycan lipid II flippase